MRNCLVILRHLESAAINNHTHGYNCLNKTFRWLVNIPSDFDLSKQHGVAMVKFISRLGNYNRDYLFFFFSIHVKKAWSEIKVQNVAYRKSVRPRSEYGSKEVSYLCSCNFRWKKVQGKWIGYGVPLFLQTSKLVPMCQKKCTLMT